MRLAIRGDKTVVPAAPGAVEREGSDSRPARSSASDRRGELDLMRALVVAGLVVFHSAEVFAVGTRWFVNDRRPDIGFGVFLLWGSLWGMPLLDAQVEVQGRAPLGVAGRWLQTEGLATAGRTMS
jgi:hypothetical protein